MGLDGISVNQLRITPEDNSAELNSQIRFNSNLGTRAVDGLSEGQIVHPDKEHEKEKRNLNKGNNSSEEDDEQEESEEYLDDDINIVKHDLSRSDKYVLKVEEETDNILIIEKATKNVIQRISAADLSVLVNYLSGSQGAIVSKRY